MQLRDLYKDPLKGSANVASRVGRLLQVYLLTTPMKVPNTKLTQPPDPLSLNSTQTETFKPKARYTLNPIP